MFGRLFGFDPGSRRGGSVFAPASIITGIPLLSRTRVWTSAEIDTMSTARTIVPAPGAGRLLVPICCVVVKPAYGAAPAGNPILQCYYENNVGGANLFSDSPVANINQTAVSQSITNRFSVTAHGVGAVPTAENQAIQIRGNIDAPGGSGTKTIKMTMFYINVPSV